MRGGSLLLFFFLQSHYPHPASLSLPSAASTTAANPTSHNAPSMIQMPLPFQGNLPPYQSGTSLQSWNSSPMPPSANGTGLTMPPMYWPGYYTPPTGFPHLQPPPFLRPPHSLAVPQALQLPVQYPGLGSLPAGFPSMPELPSFLQPGNSNSLSQTSGVPTSVSVPASLSTSETESSRSQLPNKWSSDSASVVSVGFTPPSVTPSVSTDEPSMPVSQVLPSLVNSKPVALPDSTVPSLSTDKPVIVPDASVPTYLSSSQPPSANDATPVNVAEQVPLVTPGQLLSTTSSTIVSSHALHTSAVVLSSKAAPSTVPSSQAILSVASPTQVASSSVLSQQVEVTSESKPAKQREWKAKQPVVATPGNKEPLLPAPKPVLQKVLEYIYSIRLNLICILCDHFPSHSSNSFVFSL